MASRKIKCSAEVIKVTYVEPMKMGKPWKPPVRKKGKRNAADA